MSITINVTCEKCKHTQGVDITSFNEWDIIKEQIERSNTGRIQWPKFFNRSLTKEVAECFAKGLSVIKAYTIIKEKIKAHNQFNIIKLEWTEEKLFQNLKIGVCARYGEMRSEGKEIKRVKGS